ncbi:hypothetical protein NDU88_005919 [Pleurodeles waltl]|uniref:Ribosomal protein eL8/eL30/eS12/Gadd45 domain-containing protein n=1 Tax=Pleurodeles waltl TaxID=8319 RepID=A0AAV7MCM7_PLEWA|nr:hypothetical protein NDU88_005919 [Pleurodeles waltl]
MATPATGKKGSIPKVKPLPVKTSLDNPYTIKWNTVVGEDMHFILQTLQEKFKHLGFQKIEVPSRPRKLSSKKGKRAAEAQSDKNDADLEKKGTEDAEAEESCLEQATNKPGWTHCDLRKQLAIGINEVTRALEKNELHLVLVCKSAKPPLITMHLIELSASRAVPACQVPRLSESLSPVLGLKSILALGFRKNSSCFADEVEAIKKKVPAHQVSWINYTAVENKTNSSAPEEDQPNDAMEGSVNISKKNLKRKQDESLTETSEIRPTPGVTLQPLKIKKLVPNPNRIRKPPKIKKSISKK